jgi:hypothetical protein
MSNQVFRDIRALRAAPPLLAEDPERRQVFSAALEQSEDLFAAAAVAGPAAKPLPLFYALSQAGRAISAAHVDDRERWRIRGHGLSVIANARVGSTCVKVKPSKDRRDAVAAVAAALAFEPLSGQMTVAELVAALPEVSARHLSADAPRALVIQRADDGPWSSILPGARGSVNLRIASAEQLAEELGRYANVEGYEVVVPVDVSQHGAATALLSWPAPPGGFATPGPRALRAMRDVARQVDERWYLIPRLGSAVSAAHPLLIWWALLYALSSLARYHPAEWVAALDVDRSLVAVDLEAILETAEARVPVLISDALGSSHGLPHAVMRTAFEKLAELGPASEEQQAEPPFDG